MAGVAPPGTPRGAGRASATSTAGTSPRPTMTLFAPLWNAALVFTTVGTRGTTRVPPPLTRASSVACVTTRDGDGRWAHTESSAMAENNCSTVAVSVRAAVARPGQGCP
jgi:hypothetical protein